MALSRRCRASTSESDPVRRENDLVQPRAADVVHGGERHRDRRVETNRRRHRCCSTIADGGGVASTCTSRLFTDSTLSALSKARYLTVVVCASVKAPL